MSRKFLRYIGTFLFVSFVVFSIVKMSQAKDDSIRKITQKELNAIIQSNKGKVVIVDLWATWCPPCVKEIPGFISLYKKYEDHELEIIGIAFDEKGSKTVPPFVSKMGINYPVYLAGKGIDSTYNLRAFPTTIIYDKAGNLTSRHVGYLPKKTFDNEISELIKK